MKLNNITCLNYEVGTEKAVLSLACTDMNEIIGLLEAENLMLYDGTGNPLLSLVGFDRITSIRIMLEENASEVVFIRTDSSILDLKGRVTTLEESTTEMQEASDVAAIAFVSLAQSEAIDDVTIMEYAGLFPEWDENWTGKAGTIVLQDGILYRSIHDVGIGQNTNPAETPAMWTRIGGADEEYHEWSQPIGVHDAYQTGDIVIYNGRYYVSLVDNNVWQPGTYGWEETEV